MLFLRAACEASLHGWGGCRGAAPGERSWGCCSPVPEVAPGVPRERFKVDVRGNLCPERAVQPWLPRAGLECPVQSSPCRDLTALWLWHLGTWDSGGSAGGWLDWTGPEPKPQQFWGSLM